ncbi:hypothetical protein HF984_10365 [Rothia terrae]|uniref:hypothetical protein n=1 Tax=Rothia terrae TaxID=396015 RepID=UPI001446BC6C|nr:hypothetical protein [Rothia terrae]NKZ35147.1 hypothetical protein [Rothia terrae]
MTLRFDIFRFRYLAARCVDWFFGVDRREMLETLQAYDQRLFLACLRKESYFQSLQTPGLSGTTNPNKEGDEEKCPEANVR